MLNLERQVFVERWLRAFKQRTAALLLAMVRQLQGRYQQTGRPSLLRPERVLRSNTQICIYIYIYTYAYVVEAKVRKR